MKRNITAIYAGAQAFHWTAYCGVISLAGIYLQAKGFHPTEVGIVLSIATVLPAFLQPVLAAAADRSRKLSLRGYLTILSAFTLASILLLLFTDASPWLVLAIYLFASILVHLLEPLLNSIASYSLRHQYPLDFGISRSMGSVAFAFASLGIGTAAKYFGADSMIVISGILITGFIICLYLLPHMPPESVVSSNSNEQKATACSLPRFIVRYPRYIFTMVGFFFIAAFHVMTETYLINMMERIGGDSSHVGIAMLVANVSEFVVIFFFERVRKYLRSSTWLVIAAVSYALKAFLFHIAPNVGFMFFAQCLESVTYGIFAPSILHFADDEISSADSVKGQSVWVAFFTLGGGFGNYIGGILIDSYSVPVMTLASFLFTFFGAAIVCAVLIRKPRKTISS